MTLSVSDASKIRNGKHHWSGQRFLTVNAVSLNIVASAQIDKATPFTYPLLSAIPVDNTSADWLTEGLRGRLVLIGTAPGLFDVATATLTANVTSNSITINSRHAGISDWPVDIQQLLADNLYVSIVKFRHPTGHMSSIRKGKFYKFDIEQFINGSKDPFDIMGMGRHQQAYINPNTGLARFTIDISPYHWAGQSYSSHAWGTDGQTVVSSSSTQLVIDCEPGCHEITYSRTNNKGKTTTAYRYLFANDETIFPPLNVQYSMGELDCQQDRQGATYTLSFEEPIDSTVIFPGQLILMTESPRWGSYGPDDLDDPLGVVTHHVAYVTEVQTRTARGERTTTVTAESPVKLARQVPIEKQVIIEDKTPGNWAEVTSLLSNPVGMFYYLSMLHAPYLINGHDFEFDTFLLSLRRKTINLDQDVTLGGQLEQLSRLLDGEGNIGSRCDGTTVMTRCPLYFASSTRLVMPTQWTYEAGDIEGELERGLRFRASVGKAVAGAFSFNGSSQSQAFRSMAPGYVRAQAGGEVTMDDTTVTHAAGQTRVNELSGFHLARQNKRSAAFGFKVNGNMDVAEPCDMDRWWALDLGVSYDPFGEGWSSARFLTESVSRRWSGPGTTRKEITVQVEPESFGYPGVTIPIAPGAGGTWVAQPAPSHFAPYQVKTPDLGVESIAPIMVWNDQTRLGRTFNFARSQQRWQFMRDEVLYARINVYFGYFLDPEQDLHTIVLAYDRDDDLLTLYSLHDTRDNPLAEGHYEEYEQWTLINDNAEQGFFNQAVVINNSGGRWVMIYRNHAGTHVYRTGSSGDDGWDSGEIFGHADPVPVENGEVVSVPVGAAMEDRRLVFTAHEGDKDANGDFIYHAFTADDWDGTITKIDSPSGWQVAPESVGMTVETNAIIGLYKLASPEPEDPLDVVTFTPATDYTHYEITGDGDNSGVFDFAGTYQAFADIDATDGPNGVGVNVTVELTAPYSFEQVEFDVNYIVTGATDRTSKIVISALDAAGLLIKSKTFDLDDFPDDSNPHTYTAAQCEFVGLEVWAIVVTVRLEWQDSGTETITVFVDNIDIDATLIEYATDRALYTLDPTDGAYTKRNSYQLLPFHHFGIAAEKDGDKAYAVCRDEDGNHTWLLRSTDAGAHWTKVRRVDGVHGVKLATDVPIGAGFADVLILLGTNRLGVSLDGGNVIYDVTGDWAAKLGYIGRIEGVTGVL